MTIELDRETRINTDGEVLSATRAEYSVLPRAATFFAGESPFRSGQVPNLGARD